MNVLQDRVCFASSKKEWSCKVVKVNLSELRSSQSLQRQLQLHTSYSSSDLLHAVAGVCSVSLPDMELPAIYNSLTASGCTAVVVMATPQEVLSHRPSKATVRRASGREGEPTEDADVSCDSNPFEGLISDEDSGPDSDGENEDVDEYRSERQRFLSDARRRQSLDQRSPESVGAEHCVLGCAAVLRLSSEANCSAVQVTLLAVRKSCRRFGMGRYLMQRMKDPEVVGHYNALLAFVDHKAESFFTRHGFSDDPILTAKHKAIVDHWENSTLMAYIPPFSGGGLAVGSLKSLTQFQEHYRTWRDSAITSYSVQVEMMERLRHELLLLHTKVQSQDEVIGELSQQVKELKREKALIEEEFTQYRRQCQKVLCNVAVGNAEEWLKSINTKKEH